MTETPPMTEPTLRLLQGEALRAALPALAALRIAVFRDWPYLYDGDAAYEARYLRSYAASPDALVVGAVVGDAMVGAATATPMENEDPDFLAPLRHAGATPGDTLYFGESVLDPAWRGRGLGHAFFDAREDHARRLGRSRVCFCAVVRAADDPRRPKGARDLAPFWRGRGYAPVPGAVAALAWREVGAAAETRQSLAFWMRDTPPPPSGAAPPPLP